VQRVGQGVQPLGLDRPAARLAAAEGAVVHALQRAVDLLHQVAGVLRQRQVALALEGHRARVGVLLVEADLAGGGRVGRLLQVAGLGEQLGTLGDQAPAVAGDLLPGQAGRCASRGGLRRLHDADGALACHRGSSVPSGRRDGIRAPPARGVLTGWPHCSGAEPCTWARPKPRRHQPDLPVHRRIAGVARDRAGPARLPLPPPAR
jgi:hypothetical protein